MLLECPLDMFAHQLRGVITARLECFQYRDSRRFIAQADCQVAQPALVTGTAQRRAFGAAEKLIFTPAEQLSQLGIIQAVAWLEVTLLGGLGEAVPWTDHLAVIAAKHPVTDWCAQLDGDCSLE